MLYDSESFFELLNLNKIEEIKQLLDNNNRSKPIIAIWTFKEEDNYTSKSLSIILT